MKNLYVILLFYPLIGYPLHLQDISILFPIGKAPAQSFLAKADTEGGKGKLFPRSIFEAVPELVEGHSDYSSLQVVSARLDPCFNKKIGEQLVCEPQIRLVVQSMFESQNGPSKGMAFFTSAAYHLFFHVSLQELVGVLRQFTELNRRFQVQASTEMLDVHSGLKQFNGETEAAKNYREEFHKILFSTIGESNLNQVTYMLMEPREAGPTFYVGKIWAWGGVKIKDGKIERLVSIPGVEQNVLDVSDLKNKTQVLELTHGSNEIKIRNGSTLKDTARDFVGVFRDLRNPWETANAGQTLKNVRAIQSPDAHGPETTMDCLSCHLSFSPYAMLESTRPSEIRDPHIPFSRVFSFGESILHAFSYFDYHPAISPRVVLESQEAKKQFGRLVPEL